MKKSLFLTLLLISSVSSNATYYIIAAIENCKENNKYIIVDGEKKMIRDTINDKSVISFPSDKIVVSIRTIGSPSHYYDISKQLMTEKKAHTIAELTLAGKDVNETVRYSHLYADRNDTIILNADTNNTYSILFHGTSHELQVENGSVFINAHLFENMPQDECFVAVDAWLYATDRRSKNTINPKKLRIFIFKGCD